MSESSNSSGLEDHWFTRCLGEEDRDELAKHASVRELSRGDQIVFAQDLDTNLYLIVEGKVRVTMFSSEGKEISFVDIPAGGNFGEVSAIDGKPRSADVIALTKTRIFVVPHAEFQRLCRNYPDISMELLQQVARIVRRLSDRVYAFSTLDVGSRILLEVSRIARENLDLDGIARIHNPPTQSEIASRVSCAREAVSRELTHLESEGIIARKPKKLIVNDYRRLQELIHPSFAA